MKNNFKCIQVYQTFDGKLFHDKKLAANHADDILGEELDGLFQLAGFDISRKTQYKALMSLISEEKRVKLRSSIEQLNHILWFEGGADE